MNYYSRLVEKPSIQIEISLKELGYKGYHFRCASVLCMAGSLEEFMEYFYISKSNILALTKYRTILNGRRKNSMTVDKLQTAYNNKDDELLIHLLEALFLEAIDNNLYKKVIRLLNKKEDCIQTLYKLHNAKPKLSVLAITMQI